MEAQSGMAGFLAAALKNLGFDATQLEAFIAFMRAEASKITATLERLERKVDAMTVKLDEVLPIHATREVGEASGVYVTSERFPQVLIDDVNGEVRDGGAKQ